MARPVATRKTRRAAPNRSRVRPTAPTANGAGESYDLPVALVLQGGGALGSYQAGVYEAMAEGGKLPDWVAGISIGAINAAIIAGNAPQDRVEKLRHFWEFISSPTAILPELKEMTEFNRRLGALTAIVFGQPGFFKPMPAHAWILDPRPVSFYDTEPLRETLELLVDFDRINAGETRLSVGAVNVRSGNFAYFDSAHMKLGPEHIMASGALPPGFPPVEIDGEHYWDGGLVSNTPLFYVLEDMPRRSRLAFQVDLFPASGELPDSLEKVAAREKDIRFSSRTRMGTEVFRRIHEVRHNVGKLLKKLPKSMLDEPEVVALLDMSCQTTMDIVHLIYDGDDGQGFSKDAEFSRATMHARWTAGLDDARRVMSMSPWLAPRPEGVGVRTFDLKAPAWDKTAKDDRVLRDIQSLEAITAPDTPKPSARKT